MLQTALDQSTQMSLSVVTPQRTTLCLGSWVEPETTIEFVDEECSISISSSNPEEQRSNELDQTANQTTVQPSPEKAPEVDNVVPSSLSDGENSSNRSGRPSSVSTITDSESNGEGSGTKMPPTIQKKSSVNKKSAWKFNRPHTLPQRQASAVLHHQQQQQHLHHLSNSSRTRFIASMATGRIAHLIQTLWSPSAEVVSASLVQLHSMIDTTEARKALETELYDNALELSLVRRGGHLALLRALATHHQDTVVQTMGWAALAWLCERCNIKSVLVEKGAVPLVTTILKQPTVSPLVTTEALYLLGHLVTLPKVAEQVTVHDTVLPYVVVQALPSCAHAQEIIDALFFLCQNLAAHQSSMILHAMWQAGSRRTVVRFMQESLVQWELAHHDGNTEVCQLYEDRLAVGCAICTHWAKTPFPSGGHVSVVRALIEAGALTVSAELLRLFPAGTKLRKAANPCLRAMVPEAED